MLRKEVIKAVNADIFCILETHFKSNNDDFIIQIDNYSWIEHARSMTNARAPKPSGGIGVLIKKNIY